MKPQNRHAASALAACTIGSEVSTEGLRAIGHALLAYLICCCVWDAWQQTLRPCRRADNLLLGAEFRTLAGLKLNLRLCMLASDSGDC
jgi:hypothetical protein